MKSMTYGVVPTPAEFFTAFYREVPDGVYRIRSGAMRTLDIEGDYSERGLFKLVTRLTRKWEQGNEEAGDWASSILSTLGFEWI